MLDRGPMPPFQGPPYMYPPRPYPPSMKPQSGRPTAPPHQGPPSPFMKGSGGTQKSPSSINILNGFTNGDGKLDVQKTMTTVDTAMKTYQQVSPMIKKVSALFLTPRP